MPITYRQAPKSSQSQCAAYIDVLWIASKRTFHGALLVMDARGQPLEFVHNTLAAPSGFLWPAEQVRLIGVAELCHSLFKACRLEPLLLVCRDSLGTPDYCKTAIAPSIPFAQIGKSPSDDQFAWVWVNGQPPQASAAFILAQDLRSHGFVAEPFRRVMAGLVELYPDVQWAETLDDQHLDD